MHTVIIEAEGSDWRFIIECPNFEAQQTPSIGSGSFRKDQQRIRFYIALIVLQDPLLDLIEYCIPIALLASLDEDTVDSL